MRKEVESSADGSLWLWRRAVEVKSRPRTSQRSPSVAVCFFVFSSLRTRDWRVEESAGETSCRSRTFWAEDGVSQVCWRFGGEEGTAP